jgi:acetylornithine deacetylase/succinyl-diaminopimelate desuccinylase-like protein
LARAEGNTTQVLAGVGAYREAHAAEILRELAEWLRLPNVATNAADIRRNAEKLKTMMEARGIRAEILPTASGRPMVYGELPVQGTGQGSKAAPTILFYCHYDGQAVNPSHWHSAPFDPVLRRGYGGDWATIPFPAPGEAVEDDWRLFARSAADDKAPIVALLAALDALHAQEAAPRINLKFIFDGEEEQGSPVLEAFVQRHRDQLAADLMIVADGPMHQSGLPTIVFGMRGIMTLTLTAYGATENLHSGNYGNWAPNPAMRLAQLLASMKDGQGGVLIEGYYDDVVPLSERERQAAAAIPPIEPVLQERYSIGGPDGGGKSFQELINLPTLNIRGLQSAWVGPGARTIIPSTATAEIDVRLGKGMDHERMFEKIVAHIRKQGWHVLDRDPTGEELRQHDRVIKVVKNEGYNAVRTSMDLPAAGSLIRAAERVAGGQVITMPTLGGSGPMYYFSDVGIPPILVPTVNFDNNQHGPDENLRLGHFFRAIDIFASIFLWE